MHWVQDKDATHLFESLRREFAKQFSGVSPLCTHKRFCVLFFALCEQCGVINLALLIEQLHSEGILRNEEQRAFIDKGRNSLQGLNPE